ncbi:MAG: agmatinase family protein [Nannocystaceae bacterium]|nr:agmatinase family protein [Nannocystaceae bacterium]
MTPRRIEVARFDPDGAGDPGGSVFGLPYSAQESSVVIIPVPWEPTVSYGRGTARGPSAIREASGQLDLYDPELAAHGLARPWVYGMHMLAEDPQVAGWNDMACRLAAPIVEAGGVPAGDLAVSRVDELGAQLDQWVYESAASWHGCDRIVGLVGGDHSSSFGAIQAAAAVHEGLGILHVDAHADLRVAYEGFSRSHASVMHNVLEQVPGVARIVQVGIRDLSAAEAKRTSEDPRLHTFFDHALRAAAGQAWEAHCATIVASLPQSVYVSFDIDGLDPSLCPHTGTPVPGGLDFGQAMTLLRVLATSGRRIVGFDLVEVAPPPSGSAGAAEQWDGNVGARVLHRLCGAALLSQGARDTG